MNAADARRFSRSHRLGFWMMSICANDGQSCAACATSPHNPQPTQSLLTWAMGSFRSGSSLGLMVREGQPESRMQEWSPVHTSGSIQKRVRTTRSPAATRRATSGRMRRWRASWHSPSAMITLRPLAPVRSASRSMLATPLTP